MSAEPAAEDVVGSQEPAGAGAADWERYRPTLGALHDALRGETRFRVWAPRAERVELLLLAGDGDTVERTVALEEEAGGPPEHGGYFGATVGDAPPGRRYRFRLRRSADDGSMVERPDPASRHQPEGVHGPSEVVDRRPPEDLEDLEDGAVQAEHGSWRGLPLSDHVLYELHVGTFTDAGTFDAVIPHLDGLAELGVTALELLPVAQFPGGRNWGYDGVQPFAVQSTYGGPEGLKRLVRAAHRRGLAVVMDAVYNHLGPEGNYLDDYGPYFTRRYSTPWGDALNFDGPHSEPVRRFFLENAVHWIVEHGLDGLRLDAVHAIVDNSEVPFLAELAAAVQGAGEAAGRRVHLFAESAVNTLRFLRPREDGGCGMDGQWSDDFHHALHTVLTGEDEGYYVDFGGLETLASAYRRGWVYTGQYSRYRRRRHGVEPVLDGERVDPARQVAFLQNHDQTGNRMRGDRMAALVDAPSLRLAAGAVLLAPFTPLLFMGEEYGEERPFQYFVSHGDPDLVEAVRQGRADEFAAFGWSGEVPDPQAEATFEASKLDRSLAERPEKASLAALHRELLRLRRELPALDAEARRRARVDLHEEAEVIVLRYGGILRPGEGEAGEGEAGEGEAGEAPQAVVVFAFGREARSVELEIPAGEWEVLIDSEAPRWRGENPSSRYQGRLRAEGTVRLDLAPRSFRLLHRDVPALDA